MNYTINNLLYKEQSPHNPQPLSESSDYSMAILFDNKINYNTTTTSNLSYIMVAIPQPPKVNIVHPSEPIGYECGSGTDTHSETHSDTENDRVVIIDIV